MPSFRHWSPEPAPPCQPQGNAFLSMKSMIANQINEARSTDKRPQGHLLVCDNFQSYRVSRIMRPAYIQYVPYVFFIMSARRSSMTYDINKPTLRAPYRHVRLNRNHCNRLIKTKKHPRVVDEHGLCREMNHLEGGLFVKRHPVMVDPLFMSPSASGVFGVRGTGSLASGTALDVHVAGRQTGRRS